MAFFLVYVREAHPIDGNAPSAFGLVEDPIDDAERSKVAGTCVKDLELPMPALVDRVDDKASVAYGGWPDRLYLIGLDGKIAYAGDRGPMGFDPDAWAAAIEAEKARIASGKAEKAAGKEAPTKPDEAPAKPEKPEKP
ncbi:MAG: deiodinase-like protein, partial [Planctomycetota bacterium]